MAVDVLVRGAGPAGLALAAALVERGVDVLVVTEAPDAPWVPTYAGWAHELPPEWPAWAEASWPAPEVRLDEARVHRLDRTYVRLDRAKLQARLRTNVRVVGLGSEEPARLTVDATGADVSKTSRNKIGYQVAYGEMVDLDLPMLLMDYSGPAVEGPPSFLYTMPLADGRCFVEETVLVSRPAVTVEAVQARLYARLDRMGLRRGPPSEVERCVIPMGVDLPRLDGTLAWGAAAGLIHPATGYSVARSLREAPTVADAIVAGFAEGPEAARARAWATIWPADRQRAWALYRFGMEALLRMDLAATRDFFSAFFEHDVDTWSGWLAGTLPLGAISAAMTRHFGRLPWGVRGTLVGTSLSLDGMRLVGRLIGGG